MKSKYSIITVCYNSQATIEKTIRSVLDQTYANIEYIIIDGKSNDDTVKIIEEYREKLAYFVSEEDSGVYEAMNKGIGAATGDIISFLNADDYLIHQKVIENVNQSVNDDGSNKVGVFYGNVLIYNQVQGTGHIWKPGKLNKLYFYRGALPHPATFYRKTVFDQAGLFDINYKISGDYEWLVRAFKRYKIMFWKINSLTAVFVEGGLSTNDEAPAVIETERRRIRQKYYSSAERFYYAIRNRIKKLTGI